MSQCTPIGQPEWQRRLQTILRCPFARMSRRGNCWDNAVAESFFSSLKKELIQKRIYKTSALAHADVLDHIETATNEPTVTAILAVAAPMCWIGRRREARLCQLNRGHPGAALAP